MPRIATWKCSRCGGLGESQSEKFSPKGWAVAKLYWEVGQSFLGRDPDSVLDLCSPCLASFLEWTKAVKVL